MDEEAAMDIFSDHSEGHVGGGSRQTQIDAIDRTALLRRDWELWPEKIVTHDWLS